jgi:hypothetical protein
MCVRQSISTVIVGRRALLREGIASLLQNTSYKVLVTVGSAMELEKVKLPIGRRTLAIIGVDGTNGHLESIFETINFRSAIAKSYSSRRRARQSIWSAQSRSHRMATSTIWRRVTF